MPQPDATEYLTVAEVAARFRLSKMTVYRMVRNGELRAISIGNSGRTFRIPVDAVNDIIHGISESE